MKTIFFFLLLIPELFLRAQTNNDSLLNYYPLQKGNTWIYRYIPSTSRDYLYIKRIVVGDTSLNDGHKYSIVKEYSNSSNLLKTVFARIDSSTLEVFERTDDTIVKIDSLLCTNISFNSSSLKIVSSSKDSILGSVVSTRTVDWQIDTQMLGRKRFAWKIGTTHTQSIYQGFIFGYSLIYAKVNGIEYGKPNIDSLLQFHPMQTGNIWMYRSSISGKIGIAIKTIVGDTLINNTIYKKIEWTHTLNTSKKIVLQRIDSTIGLLYEHQYNEDVMIDSIAAQDGKTFGRPYSRLCEKINLDTVFDLSLPIRTILYNIIPTTPRTTYAYGIGEVSSSSQNEDPIYPRMNTFFNLLVYAKINGKEYGTKAILIADSLAQYHPLQKGNVWMYKHLYFNGKPFDTSYVRNEVLRDTLIDGKYYQIISGRNLKYNSVGYSLERFDSLNGNYFHRSLDKDILEDSTMTSAPNAVFGGSYNNRKLINVFSSKIFDTTVTVRSITENALIKENQISWGYAYGIGLIGESDQNLQSLYVIYSSKLMYAKINGKEFGIDPNKKLMDSLARYYPLQIGNVWIYSPLGNSGYRMKTVRSDTMINNTIYKSIEYGWTADTSFYRRFERVDTATGIVYQFWGNQEKILDSMLSSLKTKFGFRQCDSITYENVLGVNTSVRHIQELVYPFNPHFHFAYGFGEIYNDFTLDTEPLFTTYRYPIIYAKINGKEFGTNPLSVLTKHIAAPTEFLLYQNYPNPFNPATVIGYQLPATSYVTLKVFDILGKEIAMLVNEKQSPGKYDVQFNASNFSSGVYFYQIQAGKFVETKKLVLMK